MTKEEALQNIKKAIGFSDTLDESIFTLFPELKESEDERTRKEIISFIQDEIDLINGRVSGDYDDRDEDDIEHQNWCRKAIAYLEKQKEQKPITINQNEKEFLADEITAFLCNYDKEFDGEDPVPSEVAEHFYLLGKQAQEQKPAEFDEYKIIKKHITEDSLSSEVNKRLTECGWYVTDEKPTKWSKDDKFKLEDAITGIDVGIGFFEREGKHPNLLKAFIEAKEWLKSLRPQPHWKPSKEQLGYLSKAIATFAEEGDSKTVDMLNELRKDLNDNFVKI